MRVADEIVGNERALRDALRRRAAGRAAFPRAGRGARARRACSSRSRPTASASTRTSPSGSRGCRSARSRSASTATAQEVYERQRPGGSLAQGACRLPRRAGGGPAAGNHVCADPAQHSRGRGGDRARPLARRLPVQHRPAHAHRHRRAAVGQARADAERSTREFRRRCSSGTTSVEGAMELCYDPFSMRGRRCAPASHEPPATLLVLPERLGQGRGGAAAHLRRFAPRDAWRRRGRPIAARGGVIQCLRQYARAIADERVTREANSWQLLPVRQRLTERRQHERNETAVDQHAKACRRTKDREGRRRRTSRVWETPKMEDVSEQVMAQPYIRFT